MSNPTKLGRLEKLSVSILTDTSKMLKDAKTELFADLGGRVLEVGAGTGVNVYFFKEKRVTEWVAVEPDLKLADECERAMEEMRGRARVFKGYLHDLDEPQGSFDCVVFSTLLCSVPDPGAIVRESHSMLKPGGKLYVIEHTKDSFGLRSGAQLLAKVPWKVMTGCNCRNNPIVALSQEGLWLEGDGDVEMVDAPLRVKKFSPLLELLKPFKMVSLTKQ